MSVRQKYLKILSGLVPVGAAGISLLLGSSPPAAANQDPAALQPRAADAARVSERLAAIRDAVSAVAPAAAAAQSNSQQAWWAWRNGGGGGWRNGGGAWRNGGGGWRNGGGAWRNGGGGWRNGGWQNFWRNW
jgi:rSAM-associated Gly-rich repeat protein